MHSAVVLQHPSSPRDEVTLPNVFFPTRLECGVLLQLELLQRYFPCGWPRYPRHAIRVLHKQMRATQKLFQEARLTCPRVGVFKSGVVGVLELGDRPLPELALWGPSTPLFKLPVLAVVPQQGR